MTEIALTVNGRQVSAQLGETLLTVLLRERLEVPTLCHDPRLKPASLCRICEVEVGGQERNLCACSTMAESGMEVHTHTPELEAYRRGVLAMLARNYAPEAVAANAHQPFHRWLHHYGLEATGTRDPDRLDATHPYIRVDMSQCIDCYRCVRICEELQGQFVWKAIERGGSTHVAPGLTGTLLKSACVSCGACVDTCPTGALHDATHFLHGHPDTWIRTTCPYCGTGCEMKWA